MTAPETLSRADLTKKLKATRKRLRAAEKTITSVSASNEYLREEIARMDKIQGTLMHNLRRVMTELRLRPESPDSKE